MSEERTDGSVRVPAVDAALEELAADRGVDVVAARDLGSHAWNLDGPDSDRDVGVLFAQDPVEYATVGGPLESVETEYGRDVELSGWNVRRFGELLVDSNPTTLEFLHGPVRYRDSPAVEALAADVGERFEPIAVYHHYRSLARSNYRKYLQRRLLADGQPRYAVLEATDDEWVVRPLGEDGIAPEPGTDPERIPKGADRYRAATTDRTVKRNVYVCRASLYARYVRDTHRFPELDFPAFLDAEGRRFPEGVVDTARDLVARKRAGEGDAVVGDLVGPEVLPPERIDPEEHAVRGIDAERVDAFIRSVVAAR